ncbi:MAG: cold-shock protein [Geodermatophilaceae bacterium]|nr:cold-shock protein [Geodermatophilaceae bacterium]
MPAEPGRPGTHGLRASRQATVAEFDADTGGGAVLHDNGRREEFPGSAFQAGGLRLLRLGQRVRLDYDAGQIRVVTLITMP